MILTALVQHKGGTLVVDLPRDRIDLEIKIRSVGIKSLSDKIQILDDEECDVSVKLFGDSDIGRHLSLLFGENNTLFEVNKTLQFVENSIEDIRDELEMNIIHDKYNSPDELVEDISRMTDELGKYTETFFFPLLGNLEEDDCDEPYEVDNSYIRSYEWDIRNLLQKEQDLDGTNMKYYFYDDDNVQKKMVSCKWDITERDRTIYGMVELRLKEPLTSEEKETVKQWVIGQNSDGLGEGLEQRPIETEDGDLYVSMWSDGDDYFIYDENEMDEYLDRQHRGAISQ